MLKELKKYLILAIVGGIGYMLFSYHFLYFGKTDIELLPKVKASLENTFVNVGDIANEEFRGPEFFIEMDDLREAGIGDVFVERGIITEEQRYQMELEASSY